MWIDAESSLQGNQDRALDTGSTREEQIAMAVATCTDGLDGDDDGFIDCEDWECNVNPLVVDAEGNPLCRGRGGRSPWPPATSPAS